MIEFTMLQWTVNDVVNVALERRWMQHETVATGRHTEDVVFEYMTFEQAGSYVTMMRERVLLAFDGEVERYGYIYKVESTHPVKMSAEDEASLDAYLNNPGIGHNEPVEF
jgi:hypothetical protein